MGSPWLLADAADSLDGNSQIHGPPKHKFVTLDGDDPPPRVQNHFGKLDHDEDGGIVVRPWSLPFNLERFLDCMEAGGGVVVVKHPRDYLGKPTKRKLWIDTNDGGRINCESRCVQVETCQVNRFSCV